MSVDLKTCKMRAGTCGCASCVAVQRGAHHLQLAVDDAPDHVVCAPRADQVLHLHLLLLQPTWAHAQHTQAALEVETLLNPEASVHVNLHGDGDGMVGDPLRLAHAAV